MLVAELQSPGCRCLRHYGAYYMNEPAVAYARAISSAIRTAVVPDGQIVDVIMALLAVAGELAKDAGACRDGFAKAASDAFDWTGNAGLPN